MTAKEFIEDWYGKPIPPDWDLEYEPLQNLSINDLEKMLKQYTLHIAEQAVRDSTESKIDEGFEHGRGHFSACMDILSRIKTLTQTNEEGSKITPTTTPKETEEDLPIAFV